MCFTCSMDVTSEIKCSYSYSYSYISHADSDICVQIGVKPTDFSPKTTLKF